MKGLDHYPPKVSAIIGIAILVLAIVAQDKVGPIVGFMLGIVAVGLLVSAIKRSKQK